VQPLTAAIAYFKIAIFIVQILQSYIVSFGKQRNGTQNAKIIQLYGICTAEYTWIQKFSLIRIFTSYWLADFFPQLPVPVQSTRVEDV
jgi:hypothetical protein